MTSNSMRIGARAAIAAACALMSGSAFAAPVFVNGLTIPGDAVDVSGDSGLGARLGFFSDLYFDPNRSEWWALADRGPGGGTLPYETRVERFTLDVNPVTGAISNFKVVQTVKFSDPANLLGTGAGAKLNGIAPTPVNVLGKAFDPEGFVVNPKTGRFIVSDEYGPSVYEFNRDGTLNRVFATPANLVPRNTGTGVPNFAGDTGNDAGKRTNRGFEGLAISPDGKFAYAMLQSAMLDEGGSNGIYNRIVKFDVETGKAVAQYGYKMEGSSQGRGISALVALNDSEFLVLERNNRGVGVDSELTPPNKKVFKINITGANDISALDMTDDGITLKPGIVLVTKTATPFLALDVASEQLAGLGNRVPEKLEGLTIGPRLGDGQYVIVSATDNDFSVTQDAGTGTQFDELFNPTTIARIRCPIGFAALSSTGECTIVNANGSLGSAYVGSLAGYDLIPGAMFAYKTVGTDLAAYTQPAAVPAPSTVVVLGSALALVAAMRRRRRVTAQG